MRRALAWIALLTLSSALASGCGAPEVRTEEGRAVFRELSRGGQPVVVTVVTVRARVADVDVDVDATDAPRPGRPATSAAAEPVETRIEERDLGDLLTWLEALGFFQLPGRNVVPDLPASRSISIETKTRRFYVTIADLRDAQGEVYGRAGAAIVQASLRGGEHISGGGYHGR